MRKISAAIATTVLAIAGCSGELELTGAGGEATVDGTAEQLFARLHSQLNAECARCHADGFDNTGPEFLDRSSATASHEALLSYQSAANDGPIVGDTPDDSKLFSYGAHIGPALSERLVPMVEAWILREAEERGTTTDPGGEEGSRQPTTALEAVRLFADCMSYGDFVATNFGDIANQNTAEGPCSSCHNRGTGGAFLDEDDARFFTEQKRSPYIYKLVLGSVTDSGAFDDLYPTKRYELKRDDNGHPNYILADTRIQSMNDFFEATYKRYRESLADPPTPCEPDLP